MVQLLVTLVQSRLIRKTLSTLAIGLWLTSRFASTHVACINSVFCLYKMVVKCFKVVATSRQDFQKHCISYQATVFW